MADNRKWFKGSCHCGSIRYAARLTPTDLKPHPDERIYRCNCKICHKIGFFHIHTADPLEDVYVFSAENPRKMMGDYRTGGKIIAFLFCKTCAAQPFLTTSELEEEKSDDLDKLSADLDKLGIDDIKGVAKEKDMAVWRPVLSAWDKKRGDGTYFSLNGHTIDAGQEGFEMRDYVDNKTMTFLDWLHNQNDSKKEPHAGGSW